VAGQRTEIVLGDVRAEVSLVNAYGDPSGTRWETARVDAAGNVIPDATTLDALPDPVMIGSGSAPAPVEPEPDADEIESLDPFGGSDPKDLIPPRAPGAAPIIPQDAAQAAARDAQHGISAPMTRVARGTTGPDGFVDLTERLSEIDEYVRIDGLRIDAAIPAGRVPRERITAAKYVVPQNATAQKVVGLLFDAMHERERELVVRWSKRTNQALGILVASSKRGALMLYEVEWAGSEKRVPPAAKIAGVADNCSPDERASARSYLTRLSQPAGALDDLVDERRALHRGLLEAAKAGESFALPERTDSATGDLAAALNAASA
jgi:hypothetical protein